MAIELTTATATQLSAIRQALVVPSIDVVEEKNKLPVPNISLRARTTVEFLTGSFGGNLGVSEEVINLINSPHVTVTDFTQEFLENNEIFVEMVVFKKRNVWNSKNVSKKTGEFISIGSQTKPWGNTFWNRSGKNQHFHFEGYVPGKPLRYNHLPINSLNQTINLGICLNNHFVERQVPYIDLNNNEQTVSLIVPSKKSSDAIGEKNRHPYSRRYKPLYVAFRYIQWLPNANNGKGQIVSGPLSKTIRVRNNFFPFYIDHFQSSFYNRPVCQLNEDFNKLDFMCFYVN